LRRRGVQSKRTILRRALTIESYDRDRRQFRRRKKRFSLSGFGRDSGGQNARRKIILIFFVHAWNPGLIEVLNI